LDGNSEKAEIERLGFSSQSAGSESEEEVENEAVDCDGVQSPWLEGLELLFKESWLPEGKKVSIDELERESLEKERREVRASEHRGIDG
jgi:hypothetical protein